MSKRILHVIRSVDPLTGGPGNVIRNVVREQVRRGHKVAVLATDINDGTPDRPASSAASILSDPNYAGAELYVGKAWGRSGAWRTFAFSPQCRRWLRKRLSGGEEPDLIHIHGVLTYVTSMAAADARRQRIPYMLEPYGSLDSNLLHHEGHHRLKRLYVKLFTVRELRNAAFVHPASQHEAGEIRHWVAPERIRVIPHGVDIPNGDLAAAKSAFLERFPSLQGRRVLLFMSRVEAQKRPELIVAAIARLRSRKPDLVMVVAGNDTGGHTQTLRAIVQQHGLESAVVFAGFLQGEMWHGAFAAADVFILPSVDENFGLAAVEAMAHGVPVIVSPGVAVHTYVDQSGGGLTVEGSVAAIGEAITRIIDGDPLAMGHRGRDFVAKYLSWSAAVEQIDQVYDEILENVRKK